MSAFAVVFDPSEAPIDGQILEAMLGRLAHRGPDGKKTWREAHVVLGHQHFWTTPEEVGEQQPLCLVDYPFMLVMDGRLDNRPDLLRELRLELDPSRPWSDAALILHAYACWGKECFSHFIGEYALVLFDRQAGTLLCGRDPLGDRTLFYRVLGQRLALASEPWALAGLDGNPILPDEVTCAHLLAHRVPPAGRTFFADVKELEPAQAMLASPAGLRTWKTWLPNPEARPARTNARDHADEFLFLLEESITCRMRATTPVAILMSGGLDSTSVACLAARRLAPQPLTTISYVFQELTSCDESRYIDLIQARWQTRALKIVGDDAWTYANWPAWPPNHNQPEGNPYRLLKERAYALAHAEGRRVLLTGGYGDHLYSAGRDWLADLLVERKFIAAGRALFSELGRRGIGGTLQTGVLQRTARSLLDGLPGLNRRQRQPVVPPWLTPHARSLLTQEPVRLARRQMRHGALLGPGAALSITGEITNASRHQVELRNPYRDRRLVEFVMSLPAYELYAGGRYKHILRQAMRGILPDPVRNRIQPTSLVPLFRRGMERELVLVKRMLQEPDGGWRPYVDPDWLLSAGNIPLQESEHAGAEMFVPWLCISFDFWYKHTICEL